MTNKNEPFYCNDPQPKEGGLISMSEFIKLCQSKKLKDSDGFGYYACKNHINSEKIIYPSYVLKNRYDDRYTHVWWFTKEIEFIYSI